MEQYMFKYVINYWEDDEKKSDKGIIVAENLKNAVERLELYYGDGISFVSLGDVPIEFPDWDGVLRKEELIELAKGLED